MDSLGDADEYYSLPPVRTTLMTPEARAITAGGLILAGLMATGIFQFLGFFLNLGPDRNGVGWQYTVSAGPSGLLALAGAWIGWKVRDEPRLGPTTRGLAVASAIVGTVIALGVAAGILTAFIAGGDEF